MTYFRLIFYRLIDIYLYNHRYARCHFLNTNMSHGAMLENRTIIENYVLYYDRFIIIDNKNFQFIYILIENFLDVTPLWMML
jgi:hypothetical protein